MLLDKNYQVIGLVRPDVEESLYGLGYLKILDRVVLRKCNLLDKTNIISILAEYKPVEIYNLAAQSSVGVSFEKPWDTINFNILSVLNILEAIKKVDKKIKFYQASSSDMFGNIDVLPVTERSIIHPSSPYGISKASAHWIAVNYRESYNLFICSGILFNHESYLRTPNFFVKKVILNGLEIKNGLRDAIHVGDIDLKRDFGYAPDYVQAMWLMLQQEVPKNYTICSGSSVSLKDILYYVFDKLEISKDKIIIDHNLFRPNDIHNIYGDNLKAKNELGWKYNKSFFEVLDLLLEEEHKYQSKTII
ncbi:MAG: GDP-mannose 4,6-dehydratase [Bacteroidales bacterium]|nr:GDP-mannose 4,6-dehydratase [Bacteroidales bacterium]